LRGEVDEGGTSSGLGWDTESAETVGEVLGGDGAAGQPAGEQPSGPGRGTHADVRLAVFDQPDQQAAEWLGVGISRLPR